MHHERCVLAALLFACSGSPGVNVEESTASDGVTELVAEDFESISARGEVCQSVRAPAPLKPGPVDVIVVLDNSGSMQEELESIERNINESFANILEDSGADYRVILLSQHRTEARQAGGSESTAVCIAQPLSSLSECPAPAPGPSRRFFHYSTAISSNDSLQRILTTYATPDAHFGQAQGGWSQWLRTDAKKVFLEVTDDDSSMTAASFAAQLVAMAPEQFGSNTQRPDFVFHSIVGLREKEVPSDAYTPAEPRTALRCRSETAQVINPGLNYQQLSRMTGGLRFPLCQVELFDTVFNYIASDVLRRSGVACSFAVPPPPDDRVLQPDHIELSYRASSGAETTLRQARSTVDCGPDAFVGVEGGISLCPSACSALNALAETPDLSVRFTCEPSYVLR